MGLTAKENTFKSDPIPEDTHVARCFAVYDIGTHYDQTFDKRNHKIIVMWEIPGLRIELEDKETKAKLDLPRAISKKYTLSLGDKANLRKDLVSWRGRDFTQDELDGFDVKNLLGVACLLQVIHTTKGKKTYANIATVTKVPKGMSVPELENPAKFFSFEDGFVIPDYVPGWVVELIKASEEYKAHLDGEAHPGDTQEARSPNDEAGEPDLPF